MKINHSNLSVRRSEVDSKNKTNLKKLELRKKTWEHTLREFKRTSRNNKMNSPKKLKKVVKKFPNSRSS